MDFNLEWILGQKRHFVSKRRLVEQKQPPLFLFSLLSNTGAIYQQISILDFGLLKFKRKQTLNPFLSENEKNRPISHRPILLPSGCRPIRPKFQKGFL